MNTSGSRGVELERALSLYRQNELAEAAAACGAILRDEPRCLEALRLLGYTQLQLGEGEAAVSTFDSALLEQPGSDELLYCRGEALLRSKRFEEAVESYDRALLARPNFPECLNNRGTALLELNRLDQALASYEAALSIRPNYPSALNNAGLALLRGRRFESAVDAFSRAIEQKPAYPAAWSNLSMAFCELRRFDEAIASADHALKLQANLPQAMLTRGIVWMRLTRHAAAAEEMRRVLEIDPGSIAALTVLSAALLRLGMPDRAVEALERIHALQPDFSYGLGDLLSARLFCCDWAQFGREATQVVEAIGAGCRVIRPLHLLGVTDSAAIQLAGARIFARDMSPAAATRLWKGERYGHEKIRVAYVSPDFREHPVSYLMAGIFEAHDRERFEVVAVSLSNDDGSPIGRRTRYAFDDFIDAADKSDSEIASLIRGREIDIAVDLKGHTDEPRAFMALRPAPVQVNYLGFPGTLGSDFHDYILADDFVIPPERLQDYSEQVVYLPECFQANDASRRADEKPPQRDEHGLPESGLILAAFSNCYKILPDMFETWMHLLRAVPDSVLWVLAESAAARGNMSREAERHGIGAHRLVFASRQPYPRHLGRLALADLFLDTLPFNGGTTVSDALWAGVPVITCAGEAFAARMAGSLLRTMDLSELIAGSHREYEALGLDLMSRPSRLRELRARLIEKRKRAGLFDTARFCRHLEAAYTTMRVRLENGLAPEHFRVPLIAGTR